MSAHKKVNTLGLFLLFVFSLFYPAPLFLCLTFLAWGRGLEKAAASVCVSPAEVGAQSGTMAGTMGRARPTMGRARSALPQWEEWATRPPTNNSHRCHFRSRGCPFHPGPCQARQEKKMQRNHWMSPPTRLFMCPTAPTHVTKPKLYKFIRLESDHHAFFPLSPLSKTRN